MVRVGSGLSLLVSLLALCSPLASAVEVHIGPCGPASEPRCVFISSNFTLAFVGTSCSCQACVALDDTSLSLSLYGSGPNGFVLSPQFGAVSDTYMGMRLALPLVPASQRRVIVTCADTEVVPETTQISYGVSILPLETSALAVSAQSPPPPALLSPSPSPSSPSPSPSPQTQRYVWCF